MEELLREQVVGQEVGLNDADEDEELEECGTEIVVERLPLLALVLLLQSLHVLVVLKLVRQILVLVFVLASGRTTCASLLFTSALNLMVTLDDFVVLLKPHLDKVATDLQLIVDVLFNVAMSEQLKDLLLVLLDLVDDRDEEDDREYHRARCCDQEVQESVEIALAVVV